MHVRLLISYSKYFFIGDYGGIAAESFFYTDIPCIVYRLNHLVKLFLAALYLHCHRAVVLVAHPAGDALRVGGVLSRIAKPDALYPTEKIVVSANHIHTDTQPIHL